MSCSPFSAVVARDALACAGELTPSSPIACVALHAIVPARCCVARQLVADVQTTRDTWRGTCPAYPSCRGCAQGRAIRAALGELVTWRGYGSGGRMIRDRTIEDRATQERARARLEQAGLLAIVPSLDEPPEGDEEEDAHAHVDAG